ncbi:MAG: VWA domain-containing protein [Planctomycetota bacterium]
MSYFNFKRQGCDRLKPCSRGLVRYPKRPCPRHGVVAVLLAVVLPVLALLAAFCINLAHAQLVRTELAIAADAAARAGGRAFSEEQSVSAAQNAAMATAAMNTVDGMPFQLNTSSGADEFEFGSTSQRSDSSRFDFTKIPVGAVSGNEVTVSAVRVNAARTSQSLGGPVEFIFPDFFSRSTFEPIHTAVAMQVDRDITLVLDRSGSMEWPTYNWPSGVNPWTWGMVNPAIAEGIFNYSRGRLYYANGNDEYSYYEWLWEEHLDLGPRPNTPWEDLEIAVSAFLNVLSQTPQQEQVAIASYSNSGRLDSWLIRDFDEVRAVVDAIQTGGATAIGSGMTSGSAAFNHANARPFASKTMVVMTDGNHNTGTAPDSAARTLMSQYKMNIQTVTFGGGANQSKMRDVAAIGNGKHYHAESGDQLISAFEEIANNLPTILTY